MALYNVISPCIVAGRHYTRPSTTPVELSDAKAKPLIEAGSVKPVVEDNFVGPVIITSLPGNPGKSSSEQA